MLNPVDEGGDEEDGENSELYRREKISCSSGPRKNVEQRTCIPNVANVTPALPLTPTSPIAATPTISTTVNHVSAPLIPSLAM